MLTVMLPDEIDKRFNRFLAETGRSENECITEALTVYLNRLQNPASDEWQPTTETLEAIDELESGDIETLTLDEFKSQVKTLLNKEV